PLRTLCLRRTGAPLTLFWALSTGVESLTLWNRGSLLIATLVVCSAGVGRQLLRCPNGNRHLCKAWRHKRGIPRRQAQGRDRGAIVLLGCHKSRQHSRRGWWRHGPGDFQRSFDCSQNRQSVSEPAEGVRDGTTPEGSHDYIPEGGQRAAGIS